MHLLLKDFYIEAGVKSGFAGNVPVGKERVLPLVTIVMIFEIIAVFKVLEKSLHEIYSCWLLPVGNKCLPRYIIRNADHIRKTKQGKIEKVWNNIFHK
jgi:hypothetical protein